MRVTTMLLAVLFAGAVSAQATFSVGGTVAANTQNFLVVDIDFASSAAPLAVTLSIAGNSSTDGLDVFLGDLDAIAATGFTGTADQGNDAGQCQAFAVVVEHISQVKSRVTGADPAGQAEQVLPERGLKLPAPDAAHGDVGLFEIAPVERDPLVGGEVTQSLGALVDGVGE